MVASTRFSPLDPELNITDLRGMTNKINWLMIKVLTTSLTGKAELNIKT